MDLRELFGKGAVEEEEDGSKSALDSRYVEVDGPGCAGRVYVAAFGGSSVANLGRF